MKYSFERNSSCLYIRFFSIILATLLVISVFIPVYAQTDLDEAKRQQEEVESRLDQGRRDLELQKSREEQLKIELSDLDNQIRVIRGELSQLDREIRVTERYIRAAERELEDAEERLVYREELLMKRLRVIYERGSVNYIEVLLESSSFAEFLTRFYYLKAIAESDVILLGEIEVERDLIAEKKLELETNKVKLETMVADVEVKRKKVEEVIDQRSRVLEELREEIKKTEQAIAELEEDATSLSKTIEEIIEQQRQERLRSGQSGTGTGTRPEGALLWPVENPCYVTSPFGWRSNPFSGGRQWHGGLDIGTYGQHNRIFSAHTGTVMFARYSGGYGNYIMVDHGGGMMTLYAHLSSMGVSAGQIVARGETIGRAGTTGASTGVHLHFEVWIDGERQDPMSFL